MITFNLGWPSQLAVNQEKTHAYAVGWQDGRLRCIDLTTGVKIPICTWLNHPLGLVVTNDEQYAYVSEQQPSGRVVKISLTTGTLIEVVDSAFSDHPSYLAWTDASENAIYVTERGGASTRNISRVNLMTLEKQEVVSGSESPGQPSSMAVSGMGSPLYVSVGGNVVRYDLFDLSGPAFMAVGHVPVSAITPEGYANTADLLPGYFYKVRHCPFGGTINQSLSTTQVVPVIRKERGMKLKVFKNNYITLVFIMIILMIIPISTLYASHPKFLVGVPLYDQEAFIWCGPATAQMIMGGYPTGSCTVLQEDIWLEILDNKTDVLWDSDPRGMEKAMEILCSPTYGWVIKVRNTAEEMMYAVAKNINQYDYPVALVMNTDAHNSYVPMHEEHWVAVTGIITDVDPVANTTATLEGVLIHDPAHSDLGFTTINWFCTASQWGTLFTAVDKPGSTYHGKYVAVMEPPKVRGRLIIPKEVLRGKIIRPEEALKFTKKWFKEYNLFEIKSFQKMRKATPLPPLLVNEKYGGYYLVPFVSEKREKDIIACVLINAYNGRLKEVGSFGARMYMTEEEVLKKAMKYFKKKSTNKMKVELVTTMKGRTYSLYSPVWKITLSRKTMYMDMAGKMLSPREIPWRN